MEDNATTDIDKLITFGQMALEQGWYDQARGYFEQALALDASNREAMRLLARVNERLSRKAATAVEPMEAETPTGPPLAKRLLVGVNSVFKALEGYSQKRARAWEERAQKRAEEQSRKQAKVREPVERRRQPEPPRRFAVDATDLPSLLLAVLDVIKQKGLNIVEIHHPGGESPPPLEAFGGTFDKRPASNSIYPFLEKKGITTWEDRSKLLIKAKPGSGFQSIFGRGPFEVLVSSSGVNFSPRTGSARDAATIFQSTLRTQQYPADGEEIIGYAKQRLERVTKEQQGLILGFLEDWIQQAETIDRLAQRVDEEPLNPNAHFELAEAIFDLGRQDPAKDYYLKALALEPGPRVVGLANLRLGGMMPAYGHLSGTTRGRIQFLGDWEKARYRFEQAVEGLEKYLRTSPNDPEAWYELGEAYFHLGSVYDVWRLNKSRARTVALAKSEQASVRAKMLQPLTSVQEKAPEAPLEHTGGLTFEAKCLRLVRAMGFNAQTTKQTGDGGIDIIARSTQPLLAGEYVIQCKDWSAPVGVSPVRDLYGVVAGTRANKGILITSSTFTKPAQDFAQGKQLELIDGEELERLYRIHVGKS